MSDTTINDMDVFDAMRLLLDRKIDLSDRAAVERALPNRWYSDDAYRRFVDWVIKSAAANIAAGGLEKHGLGVGGFVPPEPTDDERRLALDKFLTVAGFTSEAEWRKSAPCRRQAFLRTEE